MQIVRSVLCGSLRNDTLALQQHVRLGKCGSMFRRGLDTLSCVTLLTASEEQIRRRDATSAASLLAIGCSDDSERLILWWWVPSTPPLGDDCCCREDTRRVADSILNSCRSLLLRLRNVQNMRWLWCTRSSSSEISIGEHTCPHPSLVRQCDVWLDDRCRKCLRFESPVDATLEHAKRFLEQNWRMRDELLQAVDSLRLDSIASLDERPVDESYVVDETVRREERGNETLAEERSNQLVAQTAQELENVAQLAQRALEAIEVGRHTEKSGRSTDTSSRALTSEHDISREQRDASDRNLDQTARISADANFRSTLWLENSMLRHFRRPPVEALRRFEATAAIGNNSDTTAGANGSPAETNGALVARHGANVALSEVADNDHVSALRALLLVPRDTMSLRRGQKSRQTQQITAERQAQQTVEQNVSQRAVESATNQMSRREQQLRKRQEEQEQQFLLAMAARRMDSLAAEVREKRAHTQVAEKHVSVQRVLAGGDADSPDTLRMDRGSQQDRWSRDDRRVEHREEKQQHIGNQLEDAKLTGHSDQREQSALIASSRRGERHVDASDSIRAREHAASKRRKLQSERRVRRASLSSEDVEYDHLVPSDADEDEREDDTTYRNGGAYANQWHKRGHGSAVTGKRRLRDEWRGHLAHLARRKRTHGESRLAEEEDERRVAVNNDTADNRAQ